MILLWDEEFFKGSNSNPLQNPSYHKGILANPESFHRDREVTEKAILINTKPWPQNCIQLWYRIVK